MLIHQQSTKVIVSRYRLKTLVFLPNTPHSSDLYFVVGGYRRVLLPCQYFVIRTEYGDGSGPRPPVAAHIDWRQLGSSRVRRITQQCIGRQSHQSSLAIARLRLKQVWTDGQLNEPYVVALLIAIAEAQWWSIGEENRKLASGVKVYRPMIPLRTLYHMVNRSIHIAQGSLYDQGQRILLPLFGKYIFRLYFHVIRPQDSSNYAAASRHSNHQNSMRTPRYPPQSAFCPHIFDDDPTRHGYIGRSGGI